jgi:hypothetical protein
MMKGERGGRGQWNEESGEKNGRRTGGRRITERRDRQTWG